MHPNPNLLTLLVAERQQQIRAEAAHMRTSHAVGYARRLSGHALIVIGERIAGASRRDPGAAFSPFDKVLSSALHPAK